jgi:hypothetical protein
MNDFYDALKQIPNEQKKDFGQKINILRNAVNGKLEELKSSSESKIILEKEDLTRPLFLWNWALVILSIWLKIKSLTFSNRSVLQ